MRDKNTLIDLLMQRLPIDYYNGICFCDSLNLMYSLGLIRFDEMHFLQKFINENIELSLMDEIIETSNYRLFSEILNSLKN